MQEQNTTEQKPRKEEQEEIREDEQIPAHFYDSDLASVNEKDFQSDNQPPKDMILERKLLHKEKMLHIYKTILKVGQGLDRPAPYDRIQLRFREKISPEQDATDKDFLHETQWLNYNLGMENEEIERLVTSMKRKETSMFEMEELEVSKKSNIKVLKSKRTFTIEALDWTTVIDIDGDRKVLKQVENKGMGHYRVQKYDQIEISAIILCNGQEVWRQQTQEGKPIKLEVQVIDQMHGIVWKILASMKNKQKVHASIRDEHLQEIQVPLSYSSLVQEYKKKAQAQQKENQQLEWVVKIEVLDVIKVDDIYLDGALLKTTLVKGVSTARADSSSLVYFALRFFDRNKKLLYQDKCFNSDWWEDFFKLDELGCRKTFLDDYSVSKMLKSVIKRTKPAEIALIQCRDNSLFQYGSDYDELKHLFEKEQQQFPPSRIFMELRVYNFMEGKTCFNMNIEQKVKESRRIKLIGHQLLKQGKTKKAYKKYQNIISFYSAGDIDTEGYEEKISALMNSILCLMKMEKYIQMLPLCDQVLETPRHGYNPDQMTIKGPQHAKIEGDLKTSNSADSRKEANVQQNKKIIDKCLYRKAVALNKLGENEKAIICLDKIEQKTPEVEKLKNEAEKSHEAYQQKSKKIFKSMFG